MLKYLIRSTESEFYLFNEDDKITAEDIKRNNLFYLLKDSIVGGPSIVFNRYHEKGKTYIRNRIKMYLATIERRSLNVGIYRLKR